MTAYFDFSSFINLRSAWDTIFFTVDLSMYFNLFLYMSMQVLTSNYNPPSEKNIDFLIGFVLLVPYYEGRRSIIFLLEGCCFINIDGIRF